MSTVRWLTVGLVLICQGQSTAFELTVDPAKYLSPFDSSFGVRVTWPLATTEEMKVHFTQPRYLQITSDTQASFSIDNIGFNPVVDLEYGVLGPNGERTLFVTKTNELIGSQSSSEYLQLPTGTEIYGLYLRTDPEITFYNFASVTFSIRNTAIIPHAVTGDYNSDGTVDAADYVVWRHAMTQSGTDMAADGNINGGIDDGDYVVWRSSFGRPAAGTVGAGSVAAIPEPTTMALLSLAAVGSLLGQRRQLQRLTSAR